MKLSESTESRWGLAVCKKVPSRLVRFFQFYTLRSIGSAPTIELNPAPQTVVELYQRLI